MFSVHNWQQLDSSHSVRAAGGLSQVLSRRWVPQSPPVGFRLWAIAQLTCTRHAHRTPLPGEKFLFLVMQAQSTAPPTPPRTKSTGGWGVPPGGARVPDKVCFPCRAFPVCSTPGWQGCRPSFPGALAFPASLARSVPGFRSVGWAGWLGLRRSCRFPLLAGFPWAVVARRWLVLGFPGGVFPVPTAPFTASVTWCPSRLSPLA